MLKPHSWTHARVLDFMIHAHISGRCLISVPAVLSEQDGLCLTVRVNKVWPCGVVVAQMVEAVSLWVINQEISVYTLRQTPSPRTTR